nr:hypothetical protein [Candidatus Sigynarchaeota archaeon]
MTVEEIITKIVVNLIIMLIGAAILKGLAGSMIKGKSTKSYGTAFGIMFIWFLLSLALEFLLFPLLVLGGAGLIIQLLIYWFVFAALISGFYKCSFGKGLLVALVFVILIIILIIVLGFIIGIIVVAVLVLFP